MIEEVYGKFTWTIRRNADVWFNIRSAPLLDKLYSEGKLLYNQHAASMALEMATMNDNLELVKSILAVVEQGPSGDVERRVAQATVLRDAAGASSLKILKYLLSLGYDATVLAQSLNQAA